MEGLYSFMLLTIMVVQWILYKVTDVGEEEMPGSEAPPGFHDIGNNLIFVHRVDDINPFVRILILIIGRGNHEKYIQSYGYDPNTEPNRSFKPAVTAAMGENECNANAGSQLRVPRHSQRHHESAKRLAGYGRWKVCEACFI